MSQLRQITAYLFPPEIAQARDIMSRVPTYEAADTITREVLMPIGDRLCQHFRMPIKLRSLGHIVYAVLSGAMKEPNG